MSAALAALATLALAATGAWSQTDAELIRTVQERRTPEGKTLSELAGKGRWSARPAAEGRVVAFEQGPYARKGRGPLEPARRLEWLYDGKTLRGIAPNRLDPTLPMWSPDHAAVLARVRETVLSDGKTLKQGVLDRVSRARTALRAKAAGEDCVDSRPFWIVDPAPKDAVGYLVTYRWDGLLCGDKPPPRGGVAMRWIYDGAGVYAYGASGAIDPKIARWRPRRLKAAGTGPG